jgi:ferredoxin-type protein NapH
MEKPKVYSTQGNVLNTSLLMIPMIIFLFVFIARGRPDFSNFASTISFLIPFLFLGTLFFMILYTGKTDSYRAVGFVVLALFFALTFIVNLVKMRGSMTFSEEELLSCEIPFCHIVTTMIIIPAALTKSIIFPGSILTGFASIGSMLVIVIGISIALGRGFCSWGCFFGGWDDGTSRILKKPVIRKINSAFKWMPFAVLLLVSLWAAATLSPVFCKWLCPFKTVTEFQKITTPLVLVQTISFVSIFIGLVVVLPILSGKRIQCATFCPMGALMAFANKINIFNVAIDKEKCNSCYTCTSTCPTLSIDKKDIENGRPSITCMKCGKCIDKCSKQAIHYHIKGTPTNKRLTLARTLFLFPAFTLLVIFTGDSMQYGITLLIKLFTSGSII